MRTTVLAVFIVVAGAQQTFAQPLDLKAAALAAVEAAIAAERQQLPPCGSVDVGACMKLGRTGAETFEVVTFITDNVCTVLDLATTLYGIGAGILIERNPALARFSNNAPAMTAAKVGIQLAKWGIRELFVKGKGDRAHVWAGITWSATASFTCGAAVNNHRETRG